MKKWLIYLLFLINLAIIILLGLFLIKRIDRQVKEPVAVSRGTALDTVNTGTGPNTGTGDALRTAFEKLNDAVNLLNSLGLYNYTDSIATRQNINDSLAVLKAGATLAIAATDSNQYDGGYMTPKVGEIMSLTFKIDTTAGSPLAGDSTYTHGFLIGKNIEIFRGDATGGLNLQYPQAWDGYEYDNTTGQITFHPVFATGEKVFIRATDTLRWVTLKPGQNLALYSEELNRTGGTPWSVSNSLTVAAGAAPDVMGRTTLDTLKIPSDLGMLYQIITVESSTNYIASWDAQEGTATSLRYRIRDYTNSADIVTYTAYDSQTNGSTPVRISTVEFTTPATCTQVSIYVVSQGSGTAYRGWALAGRVQLAKTGGYPYAKTTTAAVE